MTAEVGLLGRSTMYGSSASTIGLIIIMEGFTYLAYLCGDGLILTRKFL